MNKTTAWILGVLVLAGATAWYFNARQPTGTHPSVLEPSPAPMVEEAAPVIRFPVEDISQTEPTETDVEVEAVPLPTLEESDPVVIAAIGAVAGLQNLPDWMVTEQLVNRLVAVVDSLTSRQVAANVLPALPPPGKFLVTGEEAPFLISAENAQRYQRYVDLFLAARTDDLVAIYTRYYPLFQQAYEGLGFPGAYFNDRLVQVLDHLAATPDPGESPGLIRHEAVYHFEDPALEALSAGQKMLLRLAPGQRRAVLERLAEIRHTVTANAP